MTTCLTMKQVSRDRVSKWCEQVERGSRQGGGVSSRWEKVRRSARTAAECSEQMQNLFLTSDECYSILCKAVVLLRAVIHVMNE